MKAKTSPAVVAAAQKVEDTHKAWKKSQRELKAAQSVVERKEDVEYKDELAFHEAEEVLAQELRKLK